MKSTTVLVKRLGAMSFEEIRTRLRAWLHQRMDAWPGGRKALEARVKRREVPPGRFFFDPGMAGVAAHERASRLPVAAATVDDVARWSQKLRIHVLVITEFVF